jgi:FkbM family methyltransferase
VKVDRHAVANRFGMMTLFCDELASTLSVQWRDMVMQRGTCKYARNTMVPVAPLTRILQDNQCPTDIDFLSIDCEGMDTEVLTTMDFKKYNVKLVCCESGHDCSTPCDLDTYLRQQGFVYLANTQVNTFWYNVCI